MLSFFLLKILFCFVFLVGWSLIDRIFLWNTLILKLLQWFFFNILIYDRYISLVTTIYWISCFLFNFCFHKSVNVENISFGFSNIILKLYYISQGFFFLFCKQPVGLKATKINQSTCSDLRRGGENVWRNDLYVIIVLHYYLCSFVFSLSSQMYSCSMLWFFILGSLFIIALLHAE